MLAALHEVPRLFCRAGAEGPLVFAHIGNNATSLEIIAATESGKAYRAAFDEAGLTSIKTACNAKLSWTSFFRGLEKSVIEEKVTTSGDLVVEAQLEIEQTDSDAKEILKGSVKFTLTTFTGDVLHEMYDNLVAFYALRKGSGKEVERVESLMKQEAEVRKEATSLETEETMLKEQMANCKAQDVELAASMKKLEAQWKTIEDDMRKAGTPLDDDEEDVELSICRIRNPLNFLERKDIDHDLFKHIKSKWLKITEEEEKKENLGDSKRCVNIIRPFTAAGFAKSLGALAPGQCKTVLECLDKIDKWDFDVFTVQQQMTGDDYASLAHQPKGGSLFVTAYALFHRYGYTEKFNISEKLLLNWLSVVESGYHPNPYHNSMHGADVLHITHFILSTGGMAKKLKLTDEDMFAALCAATIHDYDHPGINNNFHIKACTYLATLYNDRSILENKHIGYVSELMKLDKFNIMEAFNEEQRRDIRDTMVEMVLATDMGLHAKILGNFKRRLLENDDFVKKDDIRLAMSMAVKMADISNCGRPEKFYLKWCAKIADEFYMQGDRERKLGMPCSPFMDRLQPAMAKGQIAFMNYIVVPLFETISDFVPDMHFTVDHAEQNKSYWANNDDS
jgi:3',5'-cyclic-nucleotide phosphodiesterase